MHTQSVSLRHGLISLRIFPAIRWGLCCDLLVYPVRDFTCRRLPTDKQARAYVLAYVIIIKWLINLITGINMLSKSHALMATLVIFTLFSTAHATNFQEGTQYKKLNTASSKTPDVVEFFHSIVDHVTYSMKPTISVIPSATICQRMLNLLNTMLVP